jgi:tetrathionate reductase subunit B
MVVDLNKCIGCQACTASCKAEFNVPVGVFRTWVSEFEDGNYPNVKVEFLPSLCNHCDEPPCVPVCPVQAIYKREDGAVLIDSEKCIGCGYCVQACPYNAAFINPQTQVAEKCTFCTNRVEQGLAPACVETCVGGARIFGDLADPQSKVSELVSTKPVQVLKPELGTEPMVYYIGLDKNIVGRPREESA